MRRVKFGACHFSGPVPWCIMPSQPLWLYQGKFSGPNSEFCSSVVKKELKNGPIMIIVIMIEKRMKW